MPLLRFSIPLTREEIPAGLLLSFSCILFGAHVALERSLRITDSTTARATAAFIDVVADPGLAKVHNQPRNRRIIFLVMLTVGFCVREFALKAVNTSFAVILGWGKTVATLLSC